MKKQINQTKEEKRLEDFKKIAENWDNLSEYAKGKMDGIISTMATMTEQKAGQKMKEPMKLEVRNEGIRGPRLVLDGKELHHVKEYEIKSSDFIGKAELSLKMLVTFPVNQGDV